MNEVNLLKSVVIGEEVRIKSILEKWNIAKSDINKILDGIAKIEDTTIKLVFEKQKEDEYQKKFMDKRGRCCK